MKAILYMQVFAVAITVFFMGCNSSNKNTTNNRNGYVKTFDTIYDANNNNSKLVYQTFYQKAPTVDNDFIQIKNRLNDNSFFFFVNTKKGNESVAFKISDFDLFLNQMETIIQSNQTEYTVALDSLETTYMRKSLSFKKGVFIIHIYENNRNILFDLSENDIKIIKQAYKTFLEE